MIQVHFFDLPQKSFPYATASDDMEDLEKELQRHSIALDDGITHAQRDFAAGTYIGKKESIPQEFAARRSDFGRGAGSAWIGIARA